MKKASQRNLRGTHLFRILYPPTSSINETPEYPGMMLISHSQIELQSKIIIYLIIGFMEGANQA